MAENVFILGAGASKKAGAPLMGNFLDKSAELMRFNEVGTPDAFEEIFDLLADLRLVYANSHLDLRNIESVFGAIEMGNILDSLAYKSGEEITTARNALITVIVQTLERSISYPVDSHGIRAPEEYAAFVSALRSLLPWDKFSIITFNYDIAIDLALSQEWNQDIDYGLVDDGQRNDRATLLKLHGSVSWPSCQECNRIVPYYFTPENVTRVLQATTSPAYLKNRTYLLLSSELYTTHKCQANQGVNTSVSGTPLIVPPTWNKKEYHGALTAVWRRAAKELADARNIFVIGYSLPESDAFFRYLFALSTFNNSNIEKFWVYNPDRSGDVERRYRALVGSGIATRFEYKTEGYFSNAISDLKQLDI